MENRFRIAQFGDVHLDNKNIEFVAPALDEFIAMAKEHRPDLTIFTGDAFTRRGHLWPTPIRAFRNACHQLADISTHGLLAVMGNHDQTFRADTDDNLVGVLAGIEAGRVTTASTAPINIASKPGIYTYHTETGPVAIAAIPTYDKYNLKLATDGVQGDPSGIQIAAQSPESVVGIAVRGILHEARVAADGGPVVVAYHGSIAGAKLGNEQVIKAGIDVPVDREAFRGCDLGCFGHLHNPQEVVLEQGPALFYQGSIAPLSWVEKSVKPVALFHDLIMDEDGKLVRVEAHRYELPVTSHLLDVPVDMSSGQGVAVAIEEALEEVSPETRLGARVRLACRAPRADFETYRASEQAHLASLQEHYSLWCAPTLIKEITDDAAARVEMDKDVGIADAVRAWWELQPVPEEEAGQKAHAARGARLMEITSEIEGYVTDRALDAHFEFRPRALHVKNWAQFEDASLDFSGLRGITAIVGKNTAGKSNLTRAVLFALYKYQAAGDVLSDVIRNGEDKAEVVLEFEAKGEVYRVTRRMKRGKGRAASSEFHFDVKAYGTDGGGWITAVEDESADTQEAINDLVGPLDLFLATSFADQNSVDGLLEMRPAEFKDLLAKVLHRDFAGRVKLARERRANVEETRSRREIEASVLEKQADVASAQSAVWLAEEDLKQAKTELGTTEHPDDLVEVRAEKKAELEKLTAELDEVKQLRRDVADKLTPEASRAVRALADAIEAGKKVEETKAKIAELLEQVGPVPLAEDIDAAIDEGKEAADKIKELGRDWAERSFSDGQKTMELREKRTGIEKQIPALGTSIQVHEQRLARIVESKQLVEDVPCHGSSWGGVDMGTCPLIAQARENMAQEQYVADALASERDRLERLRKQEKACLQDEAAHQSEVSARNEEHQQAVEDANAWRNGVAEKYQRLQGIKSAADEVQRDIADLRVAVAAGEALAGEIETRRQAVISAEAARDDAAQKVAASLSKQAEADGLSDEIFEIEDKITELRYTRDAMRGRINERRDTLTRAEQALSSAQQAEGKIQELRTMLDAEVAEVAALATYEAALGRDGVPFLLLERYAIPEIMARTNEYLEPTEFRVEIESDRADVGGKIKAGVFVAFRDGRGTHPVSAASGFQRNALGAALRNALADLHAQATGTRIWIAIQDEGFGAYDDANLAGATETIKRVAERRESMLFVTHVPSVVEVADNVIEVVPVDGRSAINLL